MRRFDSSCIRWSNSISAKAKLGQSAEATWTGYVQPRLARLEDIRILNETRMSAALTKSLALTLSFCLRYDSRPPQSIETVDYELKNVLRLKF